MGVLGRGLAFQPVLVSLPYTQTYTYDNDTTITLQNILTLKIFHQNYFLKNKIKNKNKQTNKQQQQQQKPKHQNPTILTNVFDMALKVNTLHVKKWQRTDSHEKRNRIYLY